MRESALYPANPARNEDVCAIVLLNARGDALLQLRDDKPGLHAAGQWVFPGGHKDPGEDLVECIKREVFEETEYRCHEPRWLLSIEDGFERIPLACLHVFWETYQEGKPYFCHEGQALEFVDRRRAEEYAVPVYLIPIWDLALLAGMKNKSASGSLALSGNTQW